MSFSLSEFATLCAKYATWNELKAFLTSEEGGLLRVVEQADAPGYAIVRYTKGVSDFSKPYTSLFRSVVWNTTTNRPVSVAPVKAEKEDSLMNSPVRCTDFVEGTMLQAWREAGSLPRLATRTSLDAKGSFYSKRSFADLFAEAVSAQGGVQAFLSANLQDNQFVSFVLQHKEHRIVTPVASHRLFVVYVGSVSEDGAVKISYTPCDWPAALAALAPAVFAESKTFGNMQEVDGFFRKQNSVYTWQGMVFQNGARRWRLRNPNYTKVRGLRGAEATAAARFLRLRSTGQMKEYLKFYREEANDMWALEQKLRQRTQELYDCYVAMHKLKTKGMRDFPYSLRPHVYALHGKYLASLSAEGGAVSVQKQSVIDYVNKLSLEEQLKVLVGDSGAPVAQP